MDVDCEGIYKQASLSLSHVNFISICELFKIFYYHFSVYLRYSDNLLNVFFSFLQLIRTNPKDILTRSRRILNLAHLWRTRTPRDRKCILPKLLPILTPRLLTRVPRHLTKKSQKENWNHLSEISFKPLLFPRAWEICICNTSDIIVCCWIHD